MTVPDGLARDVVDRDGLAALFGVLRARGYAIFGPRVRDGAIVIDALEGPAELPWGWSARDGAGRSRLERRADGAAFAGGPASQPWKRLLHPAEETLFVARKKEGRLVIEPDAGTAPAVAFFGMRPCDLRALERLDTVLLGGPYLDPRYRARREGIFVVAVECTEPGGCCFCTSMATGPRARRGFDIALVERADPDHPFFLARAGSEAGREVLEAVPRRPASRDELLEGELALDGATHAMGRSVSRDAAPACVLRDPEHPQWEAVERLCLACGSCTQVCPTCFCSTVEDEADLAGTRFARVRRADSCFTTPFSYIHGGSVRSSVRARYRQWLSHKFGHWHAQFGASGCVGCGRCIAWCPAGIDVTQELLALAEEPALATEDDEEEVHADP